MRVNIYAEEITRRVEIVEAFADTGSRFIGVRFFLESSDKLHHRADDDDSSAVTFWVKSGKNGFEPGDHEQLLELFNLAIEKLDDKATENWGDR